MSKKKQLTVGRLIMKLQALPLDMPVTLLVKLPPRQGNVDGPATSVWSLRPDRTEVVIAAE